MLRGTPAHSGFGEWEFKAPYRLSWAREFQGERLGTAVEPVVAAGKVFVATHVGNLYALDSQSGEPVWRFQAHGPFLHSPAFSESPAVELVIAACLDGRLYALSADIGKLIWHYDAGFGGFSAAPVVSDGVIYIGTRTGDFLAVALADGKLRWKQSLGAPIRQTAAADHERVFITAEDMKVRCFARADGKVIWTSEQLPGQTACDYYPVIVESGGRAYVIVRTNPTLNMGQRIGRDRTMLCRNAGVDDSSWQKVDAWIKSPQARGTPELWAAEQKSITTYLDTDRDARTFFALEAETGKEAPPSPVLWAAGCQGVGAPPAVTADGRLLVFYRSAYGNWNHGVAPLVALGLLDLVDRKITPLFHQHGMQPQWNCFWGTADESQNFLVAGDTVLINHQGTLSGFNLKENKLFHIWGERDTYGGFRNPSWARNEWHGPGRAGLALSGDRIYWQTGSRILCLEPGPAGPPEQRPKPVQVAKLPPQAVAPDVTAPSRDQLRRALNVTAEAALSRNWAPLFCDPGLAGRTFAFDQSGELFMAFAWAWPHLERSLQEKAKSVFRAQLVEHPPFAKEASFPLGEGEPREYFAVPREYRGRLGGDKQPHPFGNTHALWFYAIRAGEHAAVLELWPKLKATCEDFRKSGWRLDPAKGDLFANRYLASLMDFYAIADRAEDTEAADQAKTQAEQTLDALLAWWNRAAQLGTLKTFNTTSQLDPFIGKGDGISLAVAPHRHKLALFQDLTPQVGVMVRAKAPDAARTVWATFTALCPTWYAMGEERQVHFGENFVDPPDFAMSSFRAAAFLAKTPIDELALKTDIPFCRGDLYYMTKLAIALQD
jgi:hypothetical protein